MGEKVVCIDDEIPFELPTNWAWARLSTIGITQTGNTPSKAHPEYFGNDIPFITPGDIISDQINYNNQGLSFLGKEYARICPHNSILQVCIGGSIGKAAITDREITYNQQINAITPIICSCHFVFYAMQSTVFISIMQEQAGGTATPIINKGLWDKLLIPIPPLNEQKLIVGILDQVFRYCKRI